MNAWSPVVVVGLTVVLATGATVAVAVGMMQVGLLLVAILLGTAVALPSRPWVMVVYVAGTAVALAMLTAVWLTGWDGCTSEFGARVLDATCEGYGDR